MSEWVSTKDRFPDKSHDVFFIGLLTNEHMWATRRQKPYDVVSGAYLNLFPEIYTHWMPVPEPPKDSE
jgi:hypothetical protein